MERVQARLIRLAIFTLLLSLFQVSPLYAADKKTRGDKEIQAMQGSWEGAILPIGEMGLGAFIQKLVKIEGSNHIETINVYFCDGEPSDSEKRTLIAALMEKASFSMTPLASSSQKIIERTEVVTESYVEITKDTKNNPDDILAGNVTRRMVLDTLLKGIKPDLELSGLSFDKNRRAQLKHRVGFSQKAGHTLKRNEREFSNFYIDSDGHATVDEFGIKFIKID